MPADEEQGTSKMMRIGQNRFVRVKPFLCPKVNIESGILNINALQD